MALADRMSRMGTEDAFRVRARASALEAAGRDVIHLEMGEPDFPTPAHIVEAGVRALREGRTGYAPAAGIPELREAIAEEMWRTRSLAVDPAQVVVCPGVKPGLFFTFLALIEAGDEVVLPDPGFPIVESMARSVGAVLRPYDPGTGPGRRPDLDALEAAVNDATRLVVLNSPGNPTGVVHTRDEVGRIAEIVRGRELVVLSDEIYARLTAGAEPVSVAAFDGLEEQTVLLDGFSKTYCMTGWRLGYVVAPRRLAPLYEQLMVNSSSCAVHFAQWGALEALRGPQDSVAALREALRERREALVNGIASIPGLECDRPEGAFFVYADIRGTGCEAGALARRLLDEAGVACVDGRAFGARGAGHLRFSLTADVARIREAVQRIRNLLEA